MKRSMIKGGQSLKEEEEVTKTQKSKIWNWSRKAIIMVE